MTTTRLAALALMLAPVLAACGEARVVPTPTPAPIPTQVTAPTTAGSPHVDPVPANPAGEWEAVLVVQEPEGLPGRPVSVANALAREPGAGVIVNGALFVDAASLETWLCGSSVITPSGLRCGPPALRVVGFENLDTDGWAFRTAGTVRWMDSAVLNGRIRRP